MGAIAHRFMLPFLTVAVVGFAFKRLDAAFRIRIVAGSEDSGGSFGNGLHKFGKQLGEVHKIPASK